MERVKFTSWLPATPAEEAVGIEEHELLVEALVSSSFPQRGAVVKFVSLISQGRELSEEDLEYTILDSLNSKAIEQSEVSTTGCSEAWWCRSKNCGGCYDA